MGAYMAPRYFFCALACLVYSGIAIATSAVELVLQKVPPLTVEQAPHYPQNLARFDLGAQIEGDSSTDLAAARALLAGDPTSVCSLKEGTTSFLIVLPKIENIDSVVFSNAGINGSVGIMTASAKLPASSPLWHNGQAREVSNGLVTSRVGPTEAKYIRLNFDVRTAGRIGNFGIYSATPVSDFTVPRLRKIAADKTVSEVAKINFADLHGQARIVFVSSGNDLRLANNMIDGQAGTAYAFAANDNAPAVIIDLGHARPLDRISSLSTSSLAAATFYLFDTLPGDNSVTQPERLRVDPQRQDGFRNVGTGADDGTGSVAVDFQETSARYVMVTWAPSAATSNFAIAEVAVLERITSSTLLAANSGSDRGRFDGKSVRDSKDAKDFKDVKDFSKEIPAEGPAEEQPPAEGPPPPLPRPPPFVFIPKVTPTSF
jgi:hypothetical protein